MPIDPREFRPQRILLIQLRAMGDVVLTTPVFRVLKRRYPEARIDFVTQSAIAELLASDPHLHQVIPYPYVPQDVPGAIRFALGLRRNRYDVVIDFLGTPATALMCLASRAPVRIGYNLRVRRLAYTHYDQDYPGAVYNPLAKFSLILPLGINDAETRTQIVVPQKAREWAVEQFRELGLDGRSLIAISPCAQAPARRWLPGRFAEVADWLQDNGFGVVYTWGPGERDYVKNVAAQQKNPALLSAPTSLPQLAALLERCRLLLCNCTGTKHVAVAVGTPTLTIFGPSDPRVWQPPDDPRHRYLRSDVDCITCGKDDCPDPKCMTAISASQVIQVIREMTAG
jgi:lipopolysaccharide heptosyltransferase II